MAFNRKVELTIGSDGTGLLISDLQFEFRIERSITFSENTAEFIIHNAKQDTRKEILKEGNNLIFKAGYEDDGVGVIFIGNISDSKSVQERADWITTIQAASIQSSDKALENAYISTSYGPDIFLSRPLKEVANALGLAIFGEENAQINMDNGFVFAGTARAALQSLKKTAEANGIGIYTDNNEIVLYRIGDQTSRFSPVYLDYESGLLSIDDITEYDNQSTQDPKRVGFESLIIPKLQPRGLIRVANTDQDGVYQIEKLNFNGDNFGGDNRCIGEAVG